MRYLKDKVSYFIDLTEHDNIGFDCKVVKDENGKEDGEEAVIDSKEEMYKKKA